MHYYAGKERKINTRGSAYAAIRGKYDGAGDMQDNTHLVRTVSKRATKAKMTALMKMKKKGSESKLDASNRRTDADESKNK